MEAWNLLGRHALICGASRGIGRATAMELARHGAQITALARSEAALQQLMHELPVPDHRRDRHSYHVIDLMDTAALETLVKNIVEDDAVELLINNTGGPSPGPLHQSDPEALEQAFRQHILAAQTITRVVIPGMIKANYGRIINIISTSVKEPIYGLGVSNTIRGAMGNWAKTLSLELAPGGITVNNILPGYTDTDRLQQIILRRAQLRGVKPELILKEMLAQVPAGRLANPRETAQAVAFLAMPAASYINGINLPVDGGRTKSL